MSKLFHISPRQGLKILLPSHPAEDVINGKLVWDEEDKGFFKKSVSFGSSIEGCLQDVPMIKGYIYVPDEDIDESEIREFYKEAGSHILSQLSQEVRVYRPVKVKCIGEFGRKITADGFKYDIKFYGKPSDD